MSIALANWLTHDHKRSLAPLQITSVFDDPKLPRGGVLRRFLEAASLEAAAQQLAYRRCARRQPVLEPPVVNRLQFLQIEHKLELFRAFRRTFFRRHLAPLRSFDRLKLRYLLHLHIALRLRDQRRQHRLHRIHMLSICFYLNFDSHCPHCGLTDNGGSFDLCSTEYDP